MSLLSHDILERFRLAHGKDIDLSLRTPYADLLASFGHPELRLPPAIVVAGTNGKGSTCAFLRAITECSGHKAHVYTSPHLISFHERIRIAGQLISEEELSSILAEAERLAQPGGVSLFEAQTAAAFVAFSRHAADLAILEVGLGGRLDATNVLPAPAACLIARLSFDHREYLGTTMTDIAREKAGIMRKGVPCFSMRQPSAEALDSLRKEATIKQAPLFVGGTDWLIEEAGKTHFRFVSPNRTIDDLPRPALPGDHQLWNAGLAIAALPALPFAVSDEAVRAAMGAVEWKARLQHVTEGALLKIAPKDSELWIDGGHNDSAGEVLAAQLSKWAEEDGKPVDVVFGMLATKNPKEFITPLIPFLRSVRTVPIHCEMQSHSATDLQSLLAALGVSDVCAAPSLDEALQDLRAFPSSGPRRILICGSLYLAGHALSCNQAEDKISQQ